MDTLELLKITEKNLIKAAQSFAPSKRLKAHLRRVQAEIARREAGGK